MPKSISSPTTEGSRHLVAPELVAGLEMFPRITFSDESVALMRAARATGMALPPLTPDQQSVRREERFVPGPQGAPDVRVLIYAPSKAASARPALLHIHGGGYVLGTPEMNDVSNRQLVVDHGCVVVSVDYRLAPEAQFPHAREDCYAALVWLHAHAVELGVDRARIAIGGESAGAGHVAALALVARDRGEVPICLQILESPMLDDRTGSSAEPHPYCGEFVWTAALNKFGWRALLGMEPGGQEVSSEAVPARAANLAGLPSTFIAIGALDLFLEESLEYARRLIRAGVPTELHVFEGAYHGFAVAGADQPQGQSLARLCREAMTRAFAV